MASWMKAPDSVADLAQDIIEAHHPRLRHARIALLFRDMPGTSQGKNVLAKASKFPSKLRPYADYDFLIWIAETWWLDADPHKKRALLDHELCHCSYSDANEPTIVGHDVEEFVEIINRYGAWNHSINDLGEAMMQGVLVPDGLSGKVDNIDPATLDGGGRGEAEDTEPTGDLWGDVLGDLEEDDD